MTTPSYLVYRQFPLGDAEDSFDEYRLVAIVHTEEEAIALCNARTGLFWTRTGQPECDKDESINYSEPQEASEADVDIVEVDIGVLQEAFEHMFETAESILDSNTYPNGNVKSMDTESLQWYHDTLGLALRLKKLQEQLTSLSDNAAGV